MGRASGLVCFVAGLAASSACGDAAHATDAGDPRCAQLEQPATLDIGSYRWDEYMFVEMVPGAEMAVRVNPYGAWVVLPAIRARGVHPGGEGPPGGADYPEFVVAAYAGEELISDAVPRRAALNVGEDGAGVGWVIAVFDNPCGDPNDIDCVLGAAATLRGEISDSCGNTASAELDVVLCGHAKSSYPCLVY